MNEAEILKNKIIEYLGEDANIVIQGVGPTIGCHCGPGTLGLVFHASQR